MADNFYKLRNNYLGIEGNNSRVEPHQLMRLSKGDQNPHNMTEALEHSQNQFSSVFKNSGNYGRESSEKYRQSNIVRKPMLSIYFIMKLIAQPLTNYSL